MSLALELSQSLVNRAIARLPFERLEGDNQGPKLTLYSPKDGQPVGWVDVYRGAGDHAIDRLMHIWLSGRQSRVDTNLIWLFADRDSALPHYHAQAIHMPNDRYVYNFDLMPRVDLAIHPSYWQQVFGPISEAHGQWTRDPAHAETRLPMPPTTAVYMSPWGVAALGAARDEQQQAWALAAMYLDRCLELATTGLQFNEAPASELTRRHQALVDAHTSDAIDPRGWGGIMRTAGAEATAQIKDLMRSDLR